MTRAQSLVQEHYERQGYALLPHKPLGWELEQEKERMLDELQDEVYDLKYIIWEARQRLEQLKTFVIAGEPERLLTETLKVLDIDENKASSR